MFTDEFLNRISHLLAIKKGWESEAGDAYFKKRQELADTADEKTRKGMFNMMRNIATQMETATSAFTFTNPQPRVLDLCMAPGGYVDRFLKQNPSGLADAITLPVAYGGHHVIVQPSNRLQITYADLTMFAAELGCHNIPEDHPEADGLRTTWPYPAHLYDLTICDGQHLRTHPVLKYRESHEQSRLFCAQLVLALSKIRTGGTLITLLHASHRWPTFSLIRTFNKFSDVHIFKPQPFHKIKSSFYLVAKNIRPQSQEAIKAAERFRQDWLRHTVPDPTASVEGSEADAEKNEGGDELSDGEVEAMLQDFGAQYKELMQTVWKIQTAALENPPWMN